MVRNVSKGDACVVGATGDGHRSGRVQVGNPISSDFWRGYLGPLGGVPSVPLGFIGDQIFRPGSL